VVIKKSPVESSFETPVFQNMSLGAEELKRVEFSELAVAAEKWKERELGGAKKTSCVI
jgi:hypothetical protein